MLTDAMKTRYGILSSSMSRSEIQGVRLARVRLNETIGCSATYKMSLGLSSIASATTNLVGLWASNWSARTGELPLSK